LGATRAMVVHGQGMDEISLLGKTKIIELRDGRIASMELDPAELGFAGASIDELGSGDAIANAALIRNILSGKERGARRDIVVLNAAAAIIVAGLGDSFQQALPLAEYSIDDGKAMHCLDKLIEVSNKG
jgi:anthranilate phosphoribosyltransferase